MDDRVLPRRVKLRNSGAVIAVNPEPGFWDASGTSPPFVDHSRIWHVPDREGLPYRPVVFPEVMPKLDSKQFEAGWTALSKHGEPL